jgi:hypothetical protein
MTEDQKTVAAIDTEYQAANAVTLPLVYEVCRNSGYEPPLVCTPYELTGAEDEEV